jgi:glyoxylase-like metal-dependent hydrolase (beta-lactamase superfamily II)
MTRWIVGDVTITSIEDVELQTDVMSLTLPDATAEAVKPLRWLFPHFVDKDGNPKGVVQSFVVQTPSRRIVVDTCVGDNKTYDRFLEIWSNLQTGFLRRLTDAGFPPDSIDTVLCTHLHADHIGWNTMLVDGKWVPTFKNARYLFGRAEFETEQSNFEATADDTDDPVQHTLKTANLESIRPVVDAGLVDLVETDHVICDEVSLVPSPGHTAGHVSVRISSKGHEALITGDSMHHPCQCAHPEWGSPFDNDTSQSIATRRRMLNDLAGTTTLLIGTHFSAPTAGHVARDGEVFRFDAAQG